VSDTLWAAVIAAVAAVFLAPLAKWLIWDRVYRLVVDVEIYKTKTEPFVEQFLKAEAAKLRPDYETADRLEKNSFYENYIRLTIQNTSRKKIAGISLLMSNPPPWGWAQVDEGTPIKVTEAKIPIGELQPHHKSLVQIWSSEPLRGSWMELKERFRISADELDRVRIRYPMPEYLKQIYEDRFGVTAIGVLFALTIGIIILLALTRLVAWFRPIP
jgi:hypothetical protein